MFVDHSGTTAKIEMAEQEDDDQQLFDFSRVLLQNSANEKEEVSESKQMLFKKYLGDQRQIQKFNELKSLMHFRRQTSDDAISSNYPNSSYSTVRDFTSSSLASAVGNSPSIGNFEDSLEWKELDAAIKTGNFITPASSFQKFDRNQDLMQMKEYKRIWSEPGNDLMMQHKLMEGFMFPTKSNQRLESDQSGNYSGSDHSLSIPKSSNEMGNISDSSPSTVISYSHKKSKSETIPIKIITTEHTPDRKSIETSTSLKSGTYSQDHLQLAQRFGSVVKTMRKPGHHVGPVRNPTCLCETCKRWVLDREQVQGRERAYSFGETPITRTTFWRKNNRYYV